MKRIIYTIIGEAIARQEGFYDPKNIAAINHNPGNLRVWDGYPVFKGYAQFPSAAVGFEKLYKNLAYHMENGKKTLGETIYAWAPVGDGDNNPGVYLQNVIAFLKKFNVNVTAKSTLEELTRG